MLSQCWKFFAVVLTLVSLPLFAEELAGPRTAGPPRPPGR